jgi:uncharacterized protein YbjT (DUF2867 family)
LARCLIIGCGCGGRALARSLLADGHAVRGSTRKPACLEQIADAGAEAYLGDPDRVATLVPALEHVTVACVLLGSASGSPEQIEALHGTRLQMLLGKLLDTTIRGVVYEAAGSVGSKILLAGAGRVRATCEGSSIPYALIRVDRSDHALWLQAARDAVAALLRTG